LRITTGDSGKAGGTSRKRGEKTFGGTLLPIWRRGENKKRTNLLRDHVGEKLLVRQKAHVSGYGRKKGMPE